MLVLEEGARSIYASVAGLLERNGLLLILAGCVLLHAVCALPFQSAMIMRDEAGYLADAAALAGYVFDGASSYRPGYALLLAPIFLLLDDPLAIYRGVQTINVCLCCAGVLSLYGWLCELYPGESRSRILWAVGTAAVYPAWAVNSTFAMSENALAPMFVLSAWAAFRTGRDGGWAWIAWAVCNGLLEMIHPRGVAVIVAAILVMPFIAASRREWKWLAAHVLVTATIVLCNEGWLQPFLVERLTLGSYPPNLNYFGFDVVLDSLRAGGAWADFAGRICGHLLYLMVGPLWLAWFALIEGGRSVREICRIGPISPRAAALLFVVASTLGTLALSALHFMVYRSPQLDHWMYGRYVDATLLPLLGVGFVTARRTRFMVGVVVALILAWVLMLQPHSMVTNNFNMPALWQVLITPSSSLLAACAATLAVGVVAYATRSNVLCVFAIGSAFLFATATVYRNYLSACANAFMGRHVLADYVRSNYPAPATHCVAFDPDGWRGARIWMDAVYAKYGVHLFNYGLQRMTYSQWKEGCDGPLISWERDLDRSGRGVFFAGAELHTGALQQDGPYLWTRIRRPTYSVHVDDVVSFEGPDRRSDSILGDGWFAREPHGAWSSDAADLWLPLGEDCAAGCRVDLHVSTWRASLEKPVTVYATVEGIPAGDWKLVSTTARWLTLTLHGRQIYSSGIRVRLLVPEATSPLGAGAGIDPRKLGIKILKIKVSAIR